MPRIAEIKEINGQTWVRLEGTHEEGSVTLMSRQELEDLRIAGAKDFLRDIWQSWRDLQ